MIIDENAYVYADPMVHTFIMSAVAELHPIFNHQKWTWSGDTVTESMLYDKIDSLMEMTAREVMLNQESWRAISSGRIKVECRKAGPNGLHFTVFLHTMVGN